MNPHRLLSLIPALLAAVLLAGCTDESAPIIPWPDPHDPASIELRITHESLRGFAGEVRTELLTAIVRDQTGGSLQGVAVLSIVDPEDWKGAIISNGVYRVVLSRSGDVVIRATAGNLTASRTIHLEVISSVPHLTLEAPEVIRVPPDSTKQFEVVAVCTDSAGVGIPGLLCRFRVQPDSLGTISPDSVITDSNGRAGTTFSTIRGRYGVCRITAIAGEDTARHDLGIILAGAPAQVEISADSSIYPGNLVPPNTDAVLNFSAVVKDEDGIGVPNIPVIASLESYQGGNIFGWIEPNDSAGVTDSSGITRFTFHSEGGFGRVFIVSSVFPPTYWGNDILQDEALISVSLLTTGLDMWLHVEGDPYSLLNLPPDSTGRATILVFLTDENMIGIPNLAVDFRTDLGRITRADTTDNTGTAIAEFLVTPRLDFPSPNTTEAIATIVINVRHSDLSDTLRVRVRKAE